MTPGIFFFESNYYKKKLFCVHKKFFFWRCFSWGVAARLFSFQKSKNFLIIEKKPCFSVKNCFFLTKKLFFRQKKLFFNKKNFYSTKKLFFIKKKLFFDKKKLFFRKKVYFSGKFFNNLYRPTEMVLIFAPVDTKSLHTYHITK